MKLKILFIIGLVSLALLVTFSVVVAQEATQGGAKGNSSAIEPAAPQAALGTGFTYQGQLKTSGNPVNGTCDFQFSLYDQLAGGSQVGATQTLLAVSVSSGTFTVFLNRDGQFGPTAFTGDARYLAIGVRCPAGIGLYTSLTPRQRLSAAPYALSLMPEAQISAVVTGTEDAGVLKVTNGDLGWCSYAAGLRATQGTGSTGTKFCDNVGVYGSGSFNGVLGTGDTYGVGGVSQTDYGYGVFARVDGQHGTGVVARSYGQNGTGVSAQSSGVESIAIYAINYSTAITSGFGTYSVKGSASGYDLLENGWFPSAVVGDTGVGNGVIGLSSAPNGYGVFGVITGTATNAVIGLALADTNYSVGVLGSSNATSGYGVLGSSNGANGYGVYGISNSSDGLGVYGSSNAGIGVRGVRGYSSGAMGSLMSPAILGDTDSGNGVIGLTSAFNAVGVYGRTIYDGSGAGIVGETTSASPASYAALFYGNVFVSGDLGASGAKPFRIDYPLDPANKYLFHYSVESPQVQNLYNGTIALDANGEAVVDLPVYFSAVNAGPFQYQLTAIGAPGPNLYIAKEVTGNQFKIAGGAPGMKVSWQLLGARNDPWIQDHPQTDVANKPAEEVGKYVYPEGYGQPASLQIGFLNQENPLHLMQPVAPQIPQTNGTPGTMPTQQQPNDFPGSSTGLPQP